MPMWTSDNGGECQAMKKGMWDKRFNFFLISFSFAVSTEGKEWTTPFLALTHATALWEG